MTTSALKQINDTRHEGATVDLRLLRSRVDAALNQLGAQMVARLSEVQLSNMPARDPVTKDLQSRVAHFGQISAGLAALDEECIPASGAGFGSRVTVENVDTGQSDEYMLMLGSLVDISANQVSLASPIGQALLGRDAGDEVSFATPNKQVHLLVTEVVTLMEQLDSVERSASPAG